MNLHQFKFIQEVVKRNLNLTETAKYLHTSQPGISKAILDLEEELGLDIFQRHGKRIKNVTEPGQNILKSIDVIMREIANLKRIGEQFSQQNNGTLKIATTHTQARYVLPKAILKLREIFPDVTITLHQGKPSEVAKMVLDETAEIGMATEALADYPDLVTLSCYDWQHYLLVPQNHKLATQENIYLEDLFRESLITYHPNFTGRSKVDAIFAMRQLRPKVVLEAIDSDVIKTYVRLGLGVGIVAEMSIQDGLAKDLISRPLGHIFGKCTTKLAFKRGIYLRNFIYKFTQLLNPKLTREIVNQVMTNQLPNSLEYEI